MELELFWNGYAKWKEMACFLDLSEQKVFSLFAWKPRSNEVRLNVGLWFRMFLSILQPPEMY